MIFRCINISLTPAGLTGTSERVGMRPRLRRWGNGPAVGSASRSLATALLVARFARGSPSGVCARVVVPQTDGVTDSEPAIPPAPSIIEGRP